MKRKPPLKHPPPALLLAVLFFLLLALSVEGLVRMPGVQARLPAYRSLGNDHSQFEIKWFGLERYTAAQGGLDVLVMGNSLANTGVDPDLLSQAYALETGQLLRVYNFGVEGLTLHANLELARILLERVQPRLLVYITDARDFDDLNIPDTETRFLADPWIRFQMGDWTPAGWLIDHSRALQVYLPYRNWVRADFPQTFYTYLYRSHSVSPAGYEPDQRPVAFTGVLTPGSAGAQECEQYYPAITIGPGRLEELRALIALGEAHQVQVVVVEMPVHPIVYECMSGEIGHQDIQRALQETIAQAGGTFIPDELSIPADGHADMHHLNMTGAPAFSSQLGARLAELFPSGLTR